MRRVLMTTALVAGVLWLPGTAEANGGAYFELDRTYYVHGEPGRAEYYAAIPEKHQGLLEQGPFYGFLLPTRVALKEGKPIPAQAARVGTFTIENAKRDTFRFRLDFTTPTLATGAYQLRLCNDPCTLTGFREAVYGYVTIAATATEVELLRQEQDLRSQLGRVKRELKKSDEASTEANRALEAVTASRATLAAEVTKLRAQVTELEAEPAPTPPTIDPWAAVLIALAIGLLAVVLMRRRPARLPRVEAAAAPDGSVNGHGPASAAGDAPTRTRSARAEARR